MLREIALQGLHHFFVPGTGKAAARTVIGYFATGHGGIVANQRHLALQALAPLRIIRRSLGGTEIDFVDDRQHRHFKQDRMQPRPFDHDIDFAIIRGRRLHADIFLLQMKQAQEFDEIALHETQTAEISQFLLLETQTAQAGDFVADFIDVGPQVDPFIAAFVAILHFGSRKMMQYHLHHREFIQVCVKQRSNDHGV